MSETTSKAEKVNLPDSLHDWSVCERYVVPVLRKDGVEIHIVVRRRDVVAKIGYLYEIAKGEADTLPAAFCAAFVQYKEKKG